MVETEDLSGRRLAGRYLVVRRIGAGGMGAVYEGLQEDLRRRVAIKVLRGDLAKSNVLVERFRREALAAAGLGHPHIVQVTDFQTASGDDPPFLVMELLAGRSLHRAVEETWPEKMSATRLARIAVQMLGALGAAHDAGIIHRDIKPDNVFLCDTNVGADLVKVLDFGVAKLSDEEEESGAEPLTRAGAVLGTPAYMAAEQALGWPDIDARADVYGVGACLYFACTGQSPVVAWQRPRDFEAIANAAVKPLAEHRPDLDPVFCAIVDRALRKLRDARWTSAAHMQTALERWMAGDPMPDDIETDSDGEETKSATAVVAVLAPTLTADAPPMASPATLVTKQAPDATPLAKQAPTPATPKLSSPETTLSAAASSTLASPGNDDRPAPPKRRLPKGVVAIALSAIAALVVFRTSLWQPREQPSAQIAPTPPSAPSEPVASEVPPPPPVVSSAPPPPVATSATRAPAPKASASAKGLPFDERSTGAFLQTSSAAAVRDCSRLEGPRTQTFLVKFGKDGLVSEITPTFREPLSPAQTCIEDHFRGVRTIAAGVTAVSVTLQPQPGAGPVF